jgi:hypothetical protein
MLKIKSITIPRIGNPDARNITFGCGIHLEPFPAIRFDIEASMKVGSANFTHAP